MSERSDGCATHPDALAEGSCSVCARKVCATCAAYDVDSAVCCEACGRDEEDRSRSLGSTLLALVGVGYLGALAVGVALFHARPFVGGVAAIVAIALGRILQLVFRPPVVTRRLRRS